MQLKIINKDADCMYEHEKLNGMMTDCSDLTERGCYRMSASVFPVTAFEVMLVYLQRTSQ